VELYSNPDEVVLTPFMGVGSEVYGAVKKGRKGIGIELKDSYYKQALRNLEHIKYNDDVNIQPSLDAGIGIEIKVPAAINAPNRDIREIRVI
jgi:DNA modification methylase